MMGEPVYLCNIPGVIDPCPEYVYVTNCPYESPITKFEKDEYEARKNNYI